MVYIYVKTRIAETNATITGKPKNPKHPATVPIVRPIIYLIQNTRSSTSSFVSNSGSPGVSPFSRKLRFGASIVTEFFFYDLF